MVSLSGRRVEQCPVSTVYVMVVLFLGVDACTGTDIYHLVPSSTGHWRNTGLCSFHFNLCSPGVPGTHGGGLGNTQGQVMPMDIPLAML